MKKTIGIFLFCFGALAAFAAPITQREGFRAALLPSPSFRQSSGEVKWDRQPESALDLGKFYYYGRSTQKNAKKALKYFRQAAKGGEKEAELMSALMLVYGQGQKAAAEEGFAEVQRLSREGYPLAQYALALLYADGTGADKNARQSLIWLTRAAEADVPVPAAQSELGLHYALGYPPYITKNAKKAFALTLAAAEAEYPQARYRAAQMYLNGYGTEKNEKRAFHFMRLAARDGLTEAQTALSDMYKNGIGVRQDDYGVFQWMRAAAIRGDAVAQEKTALNYLNGTGVKTDRREALFWAVRARARGGKNAEQIIKRIKEY